MDDKVKNQLSQVVTLLGIHAQEFAKLRKIVFTEDNRRLDRELQNIENNTINLQAKTEKLLKDLADGIPQAERFPFLNPYVD